VLRQEGDANMATLYMDKAGGHGIKFIADDGIRKTLFLGKKYSKKTATKLEEIIEELVKCRNNHRDPNKQVRAYLEEAPVAIREKLAKVGLITLPKRRTLDGFLTDYAKERTDWKDGTLAAFNTSKKQMLKFFGKDTQIEKISVDDAVKFRIELKKDYSEATVAKIIRHCRQVFTLARRRKMIADNPFETVPTGSQRNPERLYFVTMEEYRQLLEGCTNAKQRLIIALARIGGLRCPSELCGLRWSEILWTEKMFWVHSPKTSHHNGKGKRRVPLFPELELRFQEFYNTLPAGCDDLVFPERSDIPPIISPKKSLASWINKVAERAGMKLWEKPFQNCRSSRDTELRKTYPEYLVNMWIGHTQQVAEAHYTQVLPSDFIDAFNSEKLDAVPEVKTTSPRIVKQLANIDLTQSLTVMTGMVGN
jgi:integrase